MQNKLPKLRLLFRLLLLYTVFSAALKTPLNVQGIQGNNQVQSLSLLDKDLRKVNVSMEPTRIAKHYGRAFFFGSPFSQYCKNLINQRTAGQTSWRVIIVPAVCLPYVWRYNSNSSTSITTTTTTLKPSIRPTCSCDMVFTRSDFVQPPGHAYEEAGDFCIPNKCISEDSKYFRRRQGKNNSGVDLKCSCTSLNLVLKNPLSNPPSLETLATSKYGCRCSSTCFPKPGTGKEKNPDDLCVADVTLRHYENPNTSGVLVPETKFVTKDIRCTCSEIRSKSRGKMEAHKCECQPNS